MLEPLDEAVTALEAHVEVLDDSSNRDASRDSWETTRTAVATAFDRLDTDRLSQESDDPDAVTATIIAIGLAVDRFTAIDDGLATGTAIDALGAPFTEGRAQTIEARQLLDRLDR